jgi:DNA adenine methylase
MLTPIKIQGSKAKLADWIITKMRATKEDLWMEPFAGSCVVGLTLAPKRAIFADNSRSLHEVFDLAFRCEKETFEEFRTELRSWSRRIRRAKLPDGAATYLKLRELYNRNKLVSDKLLPGEYLHRGKQAAAFVALNRLSFNGIIRFNSKGSFNVPYGKDADRLSPDVASDLILCVAGLGNGRYEHRFADFRQTLISAQESYDCGATNVLVYCDPPYCGRVNQYATTWTDHDQALLVEALLKAKYRWGLSTWLTDAKGKDNTSVERLLRFNVHIRDHEYKCGPKAANRYRVKEALICNY